jgi:hypothetical protein
MTSELPRPLPEGAVCPPGRAVLVAAAGERFTTDAAALRDLSELAAQLLADADEEDCELPLAPEFATAPIVRLLAAWVDHHGAAPPSAIDMPVRRVERLGQLLADEWDVAFVERDVLEGRGMAASARLYALARLAVYVSAPALSRLCVAVFAHEIRRGARGDGQPTVMVRGWFGKDGDYGDAEKADNMAFLQDACRDMVLAQSATAGQPAGAPPPPPPHF